MAVGDVERQSLRQVLFRASKRPTSLIPVSGSSQCEPPGLKNPVSDKPFLSKVTRETHYHSIISNSSPSGR